MRQQNNKGNHQRRRTTRGNRFLSKLRKYKWYETLNSKEQEVKVSDKSPYITTGFGMGGYYAVKKVWYEKDQMWDNCQTSECFKTYGEVVNYAQDWAKADGIECR